MTGYKRVNYYELCRLCTSSQPKDKIHIFRDEGRKLQLQQKIQSCFPLLVCEHDYLPKVICTTCIEALDQCYVFRQNCINSEAMLSSYFSNFRFTDDFKKAGKVYVKDTGQPKLETLNQNFSGNNIKKLGQDNLGGTTTVVQDSNQQFFSLEFSGLQNTTNKLVTTTTNYPKLISTNSVQTSKTPEFLTTLTSTKPQNEQLKFLKTNEINCQTVQIPNCNNSLTNNFNSNNNNNNNGQNLLGGVKNHNNIDNSEYNLLKTNLIQPHALMYIDIEQLVESENDLNKIKDLLKPAEYNNKINHNNNNNNNNNNKDQQIISNNDMGAASKLTIGPTNMAATTEPSNNNKSDSVDNNKSFKCETCDKVFKRREHLYQHTKLHSGLRPFSCIHCPKTFSRKEHLIRHLTSHSGVKDFSCDVCNKKFSRPDNLKKHKKTHQKTGPYICEICSKSFVIKHYYLAHKLHHEDGIKNNNELCRG